MSPALSDTIEALPLTDTMELPASELVRRKSADWQLLASDRDSWRDKYKSLAQKVVAQGIPAAAQEIKETLDTHSTHHWKELKQSRDQWKKEAREAQRKLKLHEACLDLTRTLRAAIRVNDTDKIARTLNAIDLLDTVTHEEANPENGNH